MNSSSQCPSFSMHGFGDQWFSRTLVLLAFLRLVNFYLSKVYSTFSLPSFFHFPIFFTCFLRNTRLPFLSMPPKNHTVWLQAHSMDYSSTTGQRTVPFWDSLWGTHICLDYPIRTLTCSKSSWAKVLIFLTLTSLKSGWVLLISYFIL